MESGQGNLEEFLHFIKRNRKALKPEEIEKLYMGLLFIMYDEIKLWQNDNLYHCDIKLDNYLVVKGERVTIKLMDPSHCSYLDHKLDHVFPKALV
jgi:hypothetical protein